MAEAKRTNRGLLAITNYQQGNRHKKSLRERFVEFQQPTWDKTCQYDGFAVGWSQQNISDAMQKIAIVKDLRASRTELFEAPSALFRERLKIKALEQISGMLMKQAWITEKRSLWLPRDWAASCLQIGKAYRASRIAALKLQGNPRSPNDLYWFLHRALFGDVVRGVCCRKLHSW